MTTQKTAPKPQLTENQKDVVGWMKEGWELQENVTSMQGFSRYWLHKKGSEMAVKTQTVTALWLKGYLVRHYQYPITTYTLKNF